MLLRAQALPRASRAQWLTSSLCCRPRQLRTVWTTTTFVSDSSRALVNHVKQHVKPSTTATTCFALSKNIPFALHDQVYSSLANSLTSIGVVSEVLPRSTTQLIAPAFSQSDTKELYSISVATYEPTGNARAIAFQSTLQGRPNIALGREIKPTDPGDGSDSGLEAFLAGKQWGFGQTDTQGRDKVELPELEGLEPQQVKQVLFFSADREQPLLSALSQYPQASKLGLLGSSTPFHSPTGAPYTLFFDGQAAATGAVGIAIVDSKPSPPAVVDYAGLQQLGTTQQVTSSKGNIVLTLSDKNAARMLLELVSTLPTNVLGQSHERSAEKEKEFYAAVFDHEPTAPLDLTTARHVSPIMSGDPSRGAISIETEEEVKQGSFVAFLHRPTPASSPVSPPPSILQPVTPYSINLISSSPSYCPPEDAQDSAEQGHVAVVEAFVAATENGIVLSKQQQRQQENSNDSNGGENSSWVCRIAGVAAKLG
ncbi:hypothetical protein OIO90_003696 [Microbotryomycetes sp. JL221]|nr:hypothetical protein OIO90_003696 [Microbotryomycetes sp. JL221]